MKISKEKVISIIKEEVEKIYREELEEIESGAPIAPPSDEILKFFQSQKYAGNKVYLDYDLTQRKWKLMGEEQ